MKNLNYKKTLAFLYKKLNNTPIAIKEAKMLHTLCDKFDKIYGIIYNKNTLSNGRNLFNPNRLIRNARAIRFCRIVFFMRDFYKKCLTNNYLSLES